MLKAFLNKVVIEEVGVADMLFHPLLTDALIVNRFGLKRLINALNVKFHRGHHINNLLYQFIYLNRSRGLHLAVDLISFRES